MPSSEGAILNRREALIKLLRLPEPQALDTVRANAVSDLSPSWPSI